MVYVYVAFQSSITLLKHFSFQMPPVSVLSAGVRAVSCTLCVTFSREIQEAPQSIITSYFSIYDTYCTVVGKALELKYGHFSSHCAEKKLDVM